MFKYQIHKLTKGGGEAKTVLLEDILTSDVFGLMSYLPYDLLLKPFLEKIHEMNPASSFCAPFEQPETFFFWKNIEWPEHLPKIGKTSIEPDVIIQWKNILLVIEAKFLSPADGSQLLYEYIVGRSELDQGQEFYLLFINRTLARPQFCELTNTPKVSLSDYIERRIKALEIEDKFPLGQVAPSILWTNWQTVFDLVQAAEKYTLRIKQTTESSLLSELLLVLEKKGLTPFRNLDLEDFLKAKIDGSSLNGTGVAVRQSIIDFTDTKIDRRVISDFLYNPLSLDISGVFTDASFLDAFISEKGGLSWKKIKDKRLQKQ
jgi:hypothetical protein